MEFTEHILILGGSGLIGSQLANALCSQQPHIKLEMPDSRQIDLLQPQSVDQLSALLTPKTVVVMAAGIKRQRGDNLNTLEANIDMVINLARALERNPVGKVVFLSTTAVYGEGTHNLTIDEQTPISLNSFYGLSKYTGETILDRLISQQPGASLLTVRLPLVYGVGDHAVYAPSGFLVSALRGETIVLWGTGTELREFLFVEDVVEVLCRLCLSPAEGIVNLVSGTSYSYTQLIDVVRELVPMVNVEYRTRTKPQVDNAFNNQRLKSLVPDYQFPSIELGMHRFLVQEQKVLSES